MNSSRTAFLFTGQNVIKRPFFYLAFYIFCLKGRNTLLRKGMVQEAGLLQPRITHLIKENQLNLTKVNNFETITT